MGHDIAIIGSGVAGITAAYLLQRHHKITIYEKNNYIGGHTHTIILEEGPDAGTPIDTGFIICNDKTYPNFFKLLAALKVPLLKTNMSFSYYDTKTGMQYASSPLLSFFAQKKNYFKPGHWRLLKEIIRFRRLTKQKYYSGTLKGMTLDQYLKSGHFSKQTIEQFVIPMAAAIWSASDTDILQFPMENFARFYLNHGLLNMYKRPQWYVVKNGSHSYVEVFIKQFTGTIVKNTPVQSLKRSGKNITIKTEEGKKHTHDYVVIATHADEAFNMLKDPTEDEQRLLSVWKYSRNRTILHSDTFLLPPLQRAQASWNYTRNKKKSMQSITVTYNMNKLQSLTTKNNYYVTLNPDREIAPHTIIREMVYSHPIYTFESMATQKELPLLNGINHTYYCGSYFGFGFHEDAINAALQVAKKFGEAL